MKIKNFKLNSNDQVIVKIVGEVLRALHIETVEDGEADFEKFEILNMIGSENVKTRLTVRKNGVDKKFSEIDSINPKERRGAEIHRLIKKNLYRILTGDLKLAGVPYGIMHGVRPTKIIHRWLRDGFGMTKYGVIDCSKISSRLHEDYLTSYDKSYLLTEVAIRQIPILKTGGEKIIGVYVGIPFCVTRCLYCSFPSNVLPNDEKVAEFMSVLTKDINAAAAEIKRYGFKVQSIYVGGGTPTALPEKFFAEMLSKVKSAFYSDGVEEFTVECGRPDTISAEKISAMKNCHVTRVSVNPQTMQQKTLDRIGRQHSTEQVITAFNELRAAGDFNINMDLILGLPGENINDVKDSVKKVLALNPDDVTLHALAIKRGSPLQTMLAEEISHIEDFELPSDAEVQRMAYVAEKLLREKNYQPYYLYRQGYISGQIENIGYCKRGAEGIYNIQIMDERQTILGVGAAASTKVPDNENMRLQSTFHAKDLITYLRDVDKYIENREKILAEIYGPAEETAAAVVKENSSAEDNTATVEENSSAEETAATVEENSPAEENASAVEENSSAEENAATVKENSSAEETAAAVEENSPAEEIASAVKENPTAEENAATVKENSSDEETAATVEKNSPAEEIAATVEENSSAEETAATVEENSSAEEIASAVKENPTAENKKPKFKSKKSKKKFNKEANANVVRDEGRIG